MTERIYLDNSATTPVAPSVLEAMQPYFDTLYGNASSFHEDGRRARKAIDESRAIVAEALGADPGEIVFTSGATESNNLALVGSFLSDDAKRHVVVSSIEHDAVLHTAQWLTKRGIELTVVETDEFGRVDPQAIRDALRDDTLLVSIMAGNNEIGTIQPIDRIAEICREAGVRFHTDAVQAFGKIDLDLMNVDLLSLSAHKFHGPKGVGVLYVRDGVRLVPLQHGGGHERNRRSGTENVPGIVGLGAAASLARSEHAVVSQRMSAMRQQLIDGVATLPGTRLNGHPTESLPHIANFSFEAIEGEGLVMKLDEYGVSASTGSACSSPNLEASHVLLAIGVPISMAHGSLRVSMGRQTTPDEIDRFLEILPRAVEDLRAFSPFKVGE